VTDATRSVNSRLCDALFSVEIVERLTKALEARAKTCLVRAVRDANVSRPAFFRRPGLFGPE
jgi:hypothetical protein